MPASMRRRTRTTICSLTVLGSTAVATTALAGNETSVLADAAADAPAAQAATAARSEAQMWFDLLVARYRSIESYQDSARVVEITDRPGERVERVETELSCEIRDGHLQVTTPTGQAFGDLGLVLPLRTSPRLEAMALRYAVWLAPHMGLKYNDAPLDDFREGTATGFHATGAEPVTIDDRPMVHIELTSGGEPDAPTADYDAKFDLFINPESMLIERIEGERRTVDGGRRLTTVDIVTAFVSPGSDAAASDSAEEAAPGTPVDATPTSPHGGSWPATPGLDRDERSTCPLGFGT